MDLFYFTVRTYQAGVPFLLSLRMAALTRSLNKLLAKVAAAPARPAPVVTPAQVQASYLAAEFADIDVEPTDDEIVDVLMATFGMSRCDVIRRIDQFNYVEYVSAHPMPEAA